MEPSKRKSRKGHQASFEQTGNSSGNRGSRARGRKHGGAVAGRTPQRRGICESWEASQTCRFGDQCWYTHETLGVGAAQLPPRPKASQGVTLFLRRVEETLRRPKPVFKLNVSCDLEVWMQSWAALAVGAEASRGRALIRALMFLPHSSALLPPQSDLVRSLRQVVMTSSGKARKSSGTTVDTLEIVADVIEYRLLQHDVDMPPSMRDECAIVMREMRDEAHRSLFQAIKDTRLAEKASRLLCRMLGLTEKYSRKLERMVVSDVTASLEASDLDGDKKLAAWAGWRSPKLGWLQQGAWLRAAPLQKRYESIEQYSETMRQFMTMLTFYWGAGALFPKCRSRSDDRSCDQPLCVPLDTEGSKCCGRRLANGQYCGSPALWRCSRHGHDTCCETCLRRLQIGLIGKPGPKASTDIYDGVVERETFRRGGTIYILSEIVSRRPPSIGPNWRTTYRLSCSGLVAVVRLGSSCEPLSSRSCVCWAEIVPVNSQNLATKDYVERTRGRLALRLLTRTDLSTLESDPEALENGLRVAIIDLQVFVPEVASVLSTVTDPALPNHLDSIPFSSRLVGVGFDEKYPDIPVENNITKAIDFVIQSTEIDIVARLSDTLKRSLRRDLVKLASESNLHGTQLQALVGSLTNALHCTQGPPGTGKSYLGVTLIRALDVIRTHACLAGVALGPIVVLSYKNHALDELLIDVLKYSNGLRRSAKGLIRCGKPENENLAAFTERSSVEEKNAQGILSQRISCLRSVQLKIKEFHALRSALSDESNCALQLWAAGRKEDGSSVMAMVTGEVLRALRLHVGVSQVSIESNCAQAFELLRSMLEAPNENSVAAQMDIVRSISTLESHTTHWRKEGVSRSWFLLERWLAGGYPPPRCFAEGEGLRCMMICDSPGGFCQELHRCQGMSGCEHRRIEGGLLCEFHRCHFVSDDNVTCLLPRLLLSDVCISHACAVCMRVRRSPVLRKIGDACIEHSCSIDSCESESIGIHVPFCTDHCCIICAQAVPTTQMNPASPSRKVEGSRFCGNHKCAAPTCPRRRIFGAEFRQEYCLQHCCIACEGKRRIVDDNFPKARLCREHRCEHIKSTDEPCQSKRSLHSNFCHAHTCRFCVAEHLPLDKDTTDEPPRNVCRLHPLCVLVDHYGQQCSDRVYEEGQEYCFRHGRRTGHVLAFSGSVQCSGMTKKGRRCKTHGQATSHSRFYCPPHLQQMPDSSSESDDSDDDASQNDVDSQEDNCRHEVNPDDKSGSTVFSACIDMIRNGNAGIGTSNAVNADESSDTGREKVFLDDISNRVITDTNTSHAVPAAEEIIMDAAVLIDLTENVPTDINAVEKTSPAQRDGEESTKIANPAKEELFPILDVKHGQRNTVCVVSPSLDLDEQEIVSPRTGREGASVILEAARCLTSSASDLKQKSSGEADDLRSMDDVTSGGDNDKNIEHVAYGVCPDEIDVDAEQSSSSEEDLPDHFQHLRDIVGDDSSIGSDYDLYDYGSAPGDDHSIISNKEEPSEWNWDQNQTLRFRRVAKFLDGVCHAISKLMAIAEPYIELARRNRAEAAAHSFKNARVIGATVVGATRRLEAIRASEPFAMIVEEACEVLEPTLMSVLAVRSLRKLELIGDHRQLPAFVQPCWFAVQTTFPSMKVSLFERLVENELSPCIILDVQRRMRSQICDLTRCEYADLVCIEDHASTMSQKIGDHGLREMSNVHSSRTALRFLSAERFLWSHRGDLVPGVIPQIFFWNTGSKEGRAAVGLSRCNVGEAEACVALVDWLLQCGVSSVGITIITPFKGQKLTIIRRLRESTNKRATNVNVSTVDRYQGDENDIIILSLVSSRPGNRFVALKNRFIVSMSRARIGMYIIGSVEAVTKGHRGGPGPRHWLRLLSELEDSESRDIDENSQNVSQTFKGVGNKIFICCPRHNGVHRDVQNAHDFPNSPEELASFCKQPCNFVLPWCGHSCELECHSVQHEPHTKKCQALLVRPCEVHLDVPLRCHGLQAEGSREHVSLAEALKNYQCNIAVNYRRPECPHSVRLCCFERRDLLLGLFELRHCDEIVEDYIHPNCGHTGSAPTCHNRRVWEEKPPVCREEVAHERPCGCTARMTCDESIQESVANTPTLCLEAVLKPRPRCSHLLSSRCFEATALLQLWSEQENEAAQGEPPLVIHGRQYGPSETMLGSKWSHGTGKHFPPCHIKTSYQRSCGHIMTTQCANAFQLANGSEPENRCREDTAFLSPLCGHTINAACMLRSKALSLPPSIFSERADIGDSSPERMADEAKFREGSVPDISLSRLSRKCQLEVAMKRICGHVTSGIPCTKLYSMLGQKELPECEHGITVERSCGHLYETVCFRKADPPSRCEHPVEERFVYPSCPYNHSVKPGTCHALSELQSVTEPRCSTSVETVWGRCGHRVEVPCHLEVSVRKCLPGLRPERSAECPVVHADVDYCETTVGAGECLEPVKYIRRCGHEEVDIPCKRAFDWAAHVVEEPPCLVRILVDSPLCQHEIEIPCWRRDELTQLKPWGDMLLPLVTISSTEGEQTCPALVEGEHQVPFVSPRQIGLLECGRTSWVQRMCGHGMNIPCQTLLTIFNIPCDRLVILPCRDCDYKNSVPCHEAFESTEVLLCKNVVEKRCTLCSINTVEVECFKETTACNREVIARRGCGHLVKWLCGEGDPRSEQDQNGCLYCLRQLWVEARYQARSFCLRQNLQGAFASSQEDLESSVPEVSAHDNTERNANSYFDVEMLRKGLNGRVQALLPSTDVKNYIELEAVDVGKLFSAYLDILTSHIDLLTCAVEDDCAEGVLLREPPQIAGVSGSYDLIYELIPDDKPAVSAFLPVNNQYGFGVRASILSIDALSKDCKRYGADGAVTICIGAAFRYHGLEKNPPFRAEWKEIVQDYRKKGFQSLKKKVERKARKTMQGFVGAGFDYVCRYDVEQSSERVYWIPGSVLSLSKAKVQVHNRCGICWDYVLPTEGWHCPENHFLCRECFSGHVRQAKSPDALSRNVDNEGTVLCPNADCKAKFEPLLLLSQAHNVAEPEVKDLFITLQELRMSARTKQVLTAALDQQKMQLQAEFERIQKIKDIDQRQAETLRIKIVEHVLTFRCPKTDCAMAFIDFDGCYALTCAGCKGHFCAWCLSFYSTGDVHGHVATCAQNSGHGLFHGADVFVKHHRARQVREIRKLLGKETPEVQRRTTQCVQKELANLNISTKDLNLIEGT